MANMNFGVNILPKANNTYTLGNSDYKWNIFANSLNGVSLSNIITDVQINGTSILSNNIANIPIANWNTPGVIKASVDYGLGVLTGGNAGIIATMKAETSLIKAGTNIYKPIVPSNQHESVFYGLAKAAGDTTQASSSNAIGEYTLNAKWQISNMLCVPMSYNLAPVEDNEIATTNIAANTYIMRFGVLCKAITDIKIGDTITVNNLLPLNDGLANVLATLPYDIQINGTSIMSNGVATIPYATTTSPGVVMVNGYGLWVNPASGHVSLTKASTNQIKEGTQEYYPIVPSTVDAAVFYGLAKAAGDTTQAASSNAVGLYTTNAKIKIGEMLEYDAREWELIREDTFTNAESADHIITVDKDNLPFDLTDVVFLFETPKSSTIASAKGNYGQVWFYYGTGEGDYFSPEPGAWTQAVDTAAHGFAVKITQEPGGLFTCMETASTTSTNSASWRSRFVGGLTGVAQGVRKLTYTRHFSKINIRGVTGIGHYILIGKRTPT